MAILSNNQMRQCMHVILPKSNPKSLSHTQRMENISSFNALDRKGLAFGTLEKRILLYETTLQEKVYMQYPGKETVSTPKNKVDARPILIRADGSTLIDLDFNRIWDIIDNLGRYRHGDIDVLAAVFLRMAYMYNYSHYSQDYVVELVDIINNKIINTSIEQFEWNRITFSPDEIETLNDWFRIPNLDISAEAFIYYNDLLTQNEDCKYNYKKTASNQTWNENTGRINTCLSHLYVISHILGYTSLSKLISAFRRGVAPLPQKEWNNVCGTLLTRN